MSIVVRTIAIAVFFISVCTAISITEDESWLTIWFILFFFAGIPLSLLAFKDLVIHTLPKWIGPAQITLHICAIFSALVGYSLGLLAVETEHEKAILHQMLVVIFPVIVYCVPLLMVLHGVPLSRIKQFYLKPDNDN